MNKAKYEGLPPELRARAGRQQRQAAAEMAAVPWDERGPIVEADGAEARQRDHRDLRGGEGALGRGHAPGGRGLGGRAKERGFDGAALLAEARALVAKHGQGVA